MPVFWCHSIDDSEGGAVPDPLGVDDNVDRVGDEWSVVSVELARLVRRTIVVWVADRRHGAVSQAVEITSNLDSARHLVDHPVPSFGLPTPACNNILSWRHSRPSQIPLYSSISKELVQQVERIFDLYSTVKRVSSTCQSIIDVFIFLWQIEDCMLKTS